MSSDELSPTQDFARWRAELLRVARIVQDDDRVTPEEVRVRDFTRYVELVEALDGSEGVGAVTALFESLLARQDYGAYQSTGRAVFRFPPDQYAAAFVGRLPHLIQSQPQWAGEFLCTLANAGPDFFDYIAAFNEEVVRAPDATRSAIARYIHAEEDGGWLDGSRQGKLGPQARVDRAQIEAEAAAEQAEQDRIKQAHLDRHAEADARITDRRCAACGKPMPSYRRTCKHCGDSAK